MRMINVGKMSKDTGWSNVEIARALDGGEYHFMDFAELEQWKIKFKEAHSQAEIDEALTGWIAECTALLEDCEVVGDYVELRDHAPFSFKGEVIKALARNCYLEDCSK